jgi:hypothetical protein
MKMYTLVGPDGKQYGSPQRGTFGGHKGLKIYGRLDCSSANRAIAEGHYIKHRVFFVDEVTAIDAGYRPCGNCLKERYALWRQALAQASEDKKQARKIYRSLCGY